MNGSEEATFNLGTAQNLGTAPNEETAEPGRFVLLNPDDKLKKLLEPRTPKQREYLTCLALGASRIDARRMVSVSDSSLDNWSKDLAFIEVEELLESTDRFKDEALTLFIGDNLPFVLTELMIVIRGNGKDKEKAIEFFLRDLSDVMHKVDKKGAYEEMLVRIRRKSDAVDAKR